MSTTSLLGRERAIGEVAGLVERPRVRLVTLTGPGGVGKTRLAVAAGERLRRRFAAGTVFVPLEAVTDPGLMLAAIGRPAGANLAGADLPTQCDRRPAATVPAPEPVSSGAPSPASPSNLRRSARPP